MSAQDASATGRERAKADTPAWRLARRLAPALILFSLFFLVCFGFGYPTLTRYDPRETNSDVIYYHQLVTGSPRDVSMLARNRLLVPVLAKPFYWLAQGRIRTWHPVFFSLLVINSFFCAVTACLIVFVGTRATRNPALSLLAAALYLMNFALANFQLAGLVDSAEACLMMALTWALFTGRWPLLPLIAIAGAMAKESFVPLASVFALAWSLADDKTELRRSALGWIVGMSVAGLATVTAVHSILAGYTVWPWEVAISKSPRFDYLRAFFLSISDRRFWYIFIWLLPLGLWHLRRLPRPWVIASVCSAITALALGVAINAEGHAARPMFNVAGPILSLSAASLLLEAATRISSAGSRGENE